MDKYEREQGPECINCGKPVEVGQVILPYDDETLHADCEHPYRLQVERGEGDPPAVVLIGDPMLHVDAEAALAFGRDG